MISTAWLIVSTSKQSVAISEFGDVCGKQKGLSVGIGLLLTHQQSAIISDGNAQPGLKKGEAERGFLCAGLTFCHPHVVKLISRAFEGA